MSVVLTGDESEQFRLYFERDIPLGIRAVISRPLKPCERIAAQVPVTFQQEVIDFVKAHPKESFWFRGPAGVGKTVMSGWLQMAALYRTIVVPYVSETGAVPFHWRIPLRASASQIVREHHAYITRNDDSVPEPIITFRDAWRPLFIEEFEKVGPMKDGEQSYKYEVLFTIVDEVYKRRPESQIVIDSNMTGGAFEAYFFDKITRRLAEMCHRVDYFTHEIQKATEP